MQFYPKLQEYIQQQVLPQLEDLTMERKAILETAVEAIISGSQMSYTVDVMFICTHNSRRSQFGQIWTTVAARHYQVEGLETHSGGTETTAFNPRALAAIKRAGFIINSSNEKVNPHHSVAYALGLPRLECFSKVYSHPNLPKYDFVAILTCDQANESCPVIKGAHRRTAVMYKDPKVADDTPQEAEHYDERCLQIAIEMFYMIKKLREAVNNS
ncbi:MAG: protein-tyrosine-phosphatase [Aureispira sp.]|nr:protein-tyrosine-phosphatase [Aureispira sp.]